MKTPLHDIRAAVLQMAVLQRTLRNTVNARRAAEGLTGIALLEKKLGGGNFDRFLVRGASITPQRAGYAKLIKYALGFPHLSAEDRSALMEADGIFAASTLTDQDYGLLSFHKNTISLVFDILTCKDTHAPDDLIQVFAQAFDEDAEIIQKILCSKDPDAIALLVDPSTPSAEKTSERGDRIIELLLDLPTLLHKVQEARDLHIAKLKEVGKELKALMQTLRPHYASYTEACKAAGVRYESVRAAEAGTIKAVSYKQATKCLTQLREFAAQHTSEQPEQPAAPEAVVADPQLVPPPTSKAEKAPEPQPKGSLPETVLRDFDGYLSRMLTIMETSQESATALIDGGVVINEEDQTRAAQLAGRILNTFKVPHALLRHLLLGGEHLESLEQFLHPKPVYPSTTKRRK